MKKKLLSSVLMTGLISTFMFTGTADAAYKKHSTYNFTKGLTKYNATVYTDPNYFNVFYGNSKVSTGFEYKNTTNIVLSQTNKFEIGKQTKSTLSAGVDFKDYGVPANVGGSIESTKSASWGVSNTSSRTIEKSAPKGYYSYNVCINTMKVKVDRKKVKDNKSAGSITFFAPRSEPYRAIVYNKKNASYSGVERK